MTFLVCSRVLDHLCDNVRDLKQLWFSMPSLQTYEYGHQTCIQEDVFTTKYKNDGGYVGPIADCRGYGSITQEEQAPWVGRCIMEAQNCPEAKRTIFLL